MSKGSHPFPSRTRKLSPSEPMVLRGKPRGRVGRCRIFFESPVARKSSGAFAFSASASVPGGLLRLGHGLTERVMAAVAGDQGRLERGEHGLGVLPPGGGDHHVTGTGKSRPPAPRTRARCRPARAPDGLQRNKLVALAAGGGARATIERKIRLRSKHDVGG